jgi:hypothetical protein
MKRLADPYLKTVRAKEHLDDLRERLRIFREDNPITIRREDDLENHRYVLRFKVKDIPEKFALVVGDFLYCLRSSLDQLVFALAQLTVTYPKGTQFPILDAPDDAKIRGWTRGVPAEAVKQIENLQPYTAQSPAAIKSHLLWRLNRLCVIDKHRRVPTHSNVSHVNFPDFPKECGPLIERDDDAGVIRVPLHLKNKMRFEPTGHLEVIFGDSHEGIEITFEGLETIYEFVANAVFPRFLSFF